MRGYYRTYLEYRGEYSNRKLQKEWDRKLQKEWEFGYCIKRVVEENIINTLVLGGDKEKAKKNIGKFYSYIVCRGYKNKSYKIIKERYFSRKWKAKDWCYKEYCKKKGIEFESLHHVSEKRKEQGKKLYKKLQEKKQQKQTNRARLSGKIIRRIIRRKESHNDESSI